MKWKCRTSRSTKTPSSSATTVRTAKYEGITTQKVLFTTKTTMKVLTEKRPIVGDGEAVSLIHFDARKSKYHYLEYRHRCSLWQSRCSTAFVACCHRIEGIGQHRGVSYLRFAPIATGISLEVPSIALPVLGSVPA